MRIIGYSTGALTLGDFHKALQWIYDANIKAVELSALRTHELEPLVNSVGQIKISKFDFISVHAPSNCKESEEKKIVGLLKNFVKRGWPIILHPDSVYSWPLWREFGSLLLIENMDNRKPIARDADELETIFAKVPKARLCFDIGHSYQIDKSMKNALDMVNRFKSRLGQIHISEVSPTSQHLRISSRAMHDFQKIASNIPGHVPVIIETPVKKNEMKEELEIAKKSLSTSFSHRRLVFKARHQIVSAYKAIGG